jgi:replicative DNA helicase
MVQCTISMDAGIDQQRLRTDWIEDHEWERIIEAMGTLGEGKTRTLMVLSKMASLG